MKLSMGKTLPDGELELTGVKMSKLLIGSILGGIVGAMGLGGGVVFNPVLLSLGVPPTVVAATSMFLIMYSTASNTGIYLLKGYLRVKFAAWIGLWCCLGTLLCLVYVTRMI